MDPVTRVQISAPAPLLKTIFYALYEIKTQENKSGGIAIIVFSIIILTFATLFIFIK